VVSTAAVAVVAHKLHPAFTWAAAITLGAIVSPPDPVAVLSIMRSVRVPREITSILEGEGLLNDATALVIYRLAVVAAVTGAFSLSHAAFQFVAAAGGGIIIGLIIGVVAARVHHVTRQVPVVSSTVSLLTPFASYLLADLAGTSGVLAVAATGMYAARKIPTVIGPALRIQITGMWTIVSFMLESLVFILVGLELPYVARALNTLPLAELLWEGAMVSLCIVAVRIAWVLPTSYIFRSFGRWLRHSKEPLPPWRSVLFIGWAGLRGADSLVLRDLHHTRAARTDACAVRAASRRRRQSGRSGRGSARATCRCRSGFESAGRLDDAERVAPRSHPLSPATASPACATVGRPRRGDP
jgi:NhaP-type Na+/H+ or K+/H+ antiporter